MSSQSPTLSDEQIFALERPSRKLLAYYFLFALMTVPAFPVVFAVLYFRYSTVPRRVFFAI